MSFAELGVAPELIRAVEDLGWTWVLFHLHMQSRIRSTSIVAPQNQHLSARCSLQT
jgi:hypothetical protein